MPAYASTPFVKVTCLGGRAPPLNLARTPPPSTLPPGAVEGPVNQDGVYNLPQWELLVNVLPENVVMEIRIINKYIRVPNCAYYW